MSPSRFWSTALRTGVSLRNKPDFEAVDKPRGKQASLEKGLTAKIFDNRCGADDGSGPGTQVGRSLAVDRKDHRLSILPEIDPAQGSSLFHGGKKPARPIAGSERTPHRQRRLRQAQDYSVVEDSSVRVHVRQLRLGCMSTSTAKAERKLHRRNSQGRLHHVFRTVEQRTPSPPVLPVVLHGLKAWLWLLPWALAALFLATTLAAWLRHPAVRCRLRRPGRWLHSSTRATARCMWWSPTSTTA
jgi:hypothetical protein